MTEVIAFLPCRKGSQRVKMKNVKPFANKEGGLVRIKLEQLLDAEKINKIILSTNDEEVKSIAKSFNSNKIFIDHRSESLSSSETSTDALINYVGESLIKEGIVIWTHVTSPFIKAKDYDLGVGLYFEKLKAGYDSLMTVTEIKKFLWNAEGPINYDREKEKWPRTQTLDSIYEINSGFFIADSSVYLESKDRVGKKPYLHVLSELQSYDIDWEENFKIAEVLFQFEKHIQLNA